MEYKEVNEIDKDSQDKIVSSATAGKNIFCSKSRLFSEGKKKKSKEINNRMCR